MASAYGILDNFNDPLYTPDFAAISTALEFKQGKLDANREALAKYNDDLINSINVLKDEDKQYANERIEAVTKLVNQYSGQDLSNDGLLLSLKTDLSQVIDDNVKNAVYSTALYNAEQAQWKKQKEENPDKYSDDNYRYSQQNAQGYLSDGKVGSKYKGGGGFIEFKDVQADLNKQLPDRLKEKGIYSALDDQGNEYYYDTITGQKITNEDVMEVMRTIITPQHEKQLAINAWAKYDHLPDEAIRYQFNQNKSTQVADLDSDINTIQTLLNDPSVKGEERKQYLAMLPQLKAQKFDVNSQEYSPANKQGVYTQMYQKDFYGTFANAYSVNKVTDIKRSAKWEKQEEIKFAYDVKLKEVDQKNELERIATKAAFDTKAAKASSTSTDLDGDSSTTNEDTLSPSGKGWAITEAQETFNPYTQVQNKQSELITELGKMFPELITGGQKKVETMNAIQGFSLVTDEKTFNRSDNTYEYTFGINPDGSPKTKRMTKEDADKIYDLKVNTHRYTEATKVVVGEMDAARDILKDALMKTTDVDFSKLNDYSIEVYTKPNGEKAIRPKKEGTYNFAMLLQARKLGRPLTPDQEETLNLYMTMETVGTFVEGADDRAAAETHAEAYLSTVQSRYADGGIYIPKKYKNPEGESYFTNDSSVGKNLKYVEPSEYKSGLLMFSKAGDSKTQIAKRIVADQVFGGVLPVVEDQYTSESFGSDERKKSPMLSIDNLIYRISTSADPINYKVTDQDKAMLQNSVSGYITTRPKGGTGFGLVDLSGGELENDQGYTLSNGVSPKKFSNGITEAIVADTKSTLSDFNKNDQDYFIEFDPTKKTVHKNLNGAFAGQNIPYKVADKGTVYAVFEESNVKIYGDFVTPSIDGSKEVPANITIANPINMTPEQFKMVSGQVEKREKISPFDVTHKNPMTESFTPRQSTILTNNVAKSLSETMKYLKKDDGTPMGVYPEVLQSTMSNINVQVRPIDSSYYVVVSVPTMTEQGQQSFTEVPVFDIGTGKPSVEEVKDIIQLYNTTEKILGDPIAADEIQAIILQNQIVYNNFNTSK